ncbi:hypothetical protein [Paenibacillus sp. S150]|uniref:hypothetical protein n=1 Tax=Paenibacillus sp. S150 TaxID=2749826 RepID=UPI001C584C6A|nr:hypothetical protein [Paenibacillus sp. S150]MBW4081441.1 hypothetical protein [Paenibacillus sp. S150]
MTYSQISNNSGNASDILYLEQQIQAVKAEIARAGAAGRKEAAEQAGNKLAELEAKLDELVD